MIVTSVNLNQASTIKNLENIADYIQYSLYEIVNKKLLVTNSGTNEIKQNNKTSLHFIIIDLENLCLILTWHYLLLIFHD